MTDTRCDTMSQWLTAFFMDESEMANELNLFGWQHILLLLVTGAAAFFLFYHREALRLSLIHI